MEYVGHVDPDGYDEVVLRGDTAARTFTAFWLRNGQVLAGMHANDWDATDHIRRSSAPPRRRTAARPDGVAGRLASS